MDQLFNAIGGHEFKKIVLDSIARAFDETGEFQEHVTFPKVYWDFRLELKVYPAPPGREVREVAVRGKEIREETSIEQDENAKIITFEQHEGIDTPDLAREQNNLPIPTPTVGPDGILGDKAVMSPREPEPAPVKIETRLAKTATVAEVLKADLKSAVQQVQGVPITDEMRDAIYAAAPIPKEAAAKVVIETRANPGGARPMKKGE